MAAAVLTPRVRLMTVCDRVRERPENATHPKASVLDRKGNYDGAFGCWGSRSRSCTGIGNRTLGQGDVGNGSKEVSARRPERNNKGILQIIVVGKLVQCKISEGKRR